MFTNHSTRKLLQLKTDLRGTLRNKRCEILTTPVNNTIKAIDSELSNRGLEPIKRIK